MFRNYEIVRGPVICFAILVFCLLAPQVLIIWRERLFSNNISFVNGLALSINNTFKQKEELLRKQIADLEQQLDNVTKQNDEWKKYYQQEQEFIRRGFRSQSEIFRTSIPSHRHQLRKPPKLTTFSDILLIINFNEPHYENIPLLRQLYSEHFPHLIFVGEKADPRVFNMSTSNGRLMHRIIPPVAEKYPNVSGYLLINDDAILNYWNIGELDRSKFWYLLSFSLLNMRFIDLCWALNVSNPYTPNGFLAWDVDYGGMAASYQVSTSLISLIFLARTD